jgi:uncharacterized glyoxalase superfamily protein PhnB
MLGLPVVQEVEAMTEKTAVSADVVPFFRYADAKRAIAFLEEAFGFERVMVIDGDGDTIHHAQMRLGNGIIMLSTRTGDGTELKSAADAGGPTMGVYWIVDDADAHCARARAAGAQVLREPQDEDYGGRDYTVLDLEGNVWSFGTYRPES